MPISSAKDKQIAQKELEDAFNKIKSDYLKSSNHKDELKFTGSDTGAVVQEVKKNIKEACSFLNVRLITLDLKFKKEYPEAYKYAEKFPDQAKALANDAYGFSIKTARKGYAYVKDVVREADIELYKENPKLYKKISSTVKEAPDEINKQTRKAIKFVNDAYRNLDNEFAKKYPELRKDMETFIKTQGEKIQKDGLYHPWGEEYRRKIAALVGLEKEVDNMYELGLASLLHSKEVLLCGEFIKLLQNDPDIIRLNDKIQKDISSKLRQKRHRLSNQVDFEDYEGKNKNERICLGGKRHPDNMMKQLKNILNFDKYKATWKVGLNKLTWTIRNGKVNYSYKLRAVYNSYGYAYILKINYKIVDTLDLRPHSENKLDFNTPYNIVTSVLGTAYHDIIGGSDKLKVKADWNSVILTKPTPW